MPLKSHESLVVRRVYHGYPLFTTGQPRSSFKSTGHSYSSYHSPYRYHPHGCKSAPIEQHQEENSREYEDEHWLFATRPNRLPLRLAVSRTSSRCQARRALEAYRDRPLTPVSPNSVEPRDPESYCPSKEAGFTGQNTPVASLEFRITPEEKVRTGSQPVTPSIAQQLRRRNRSTAQSRTGLDGPLSSDSDNVSKFLRDELSDLTSSRSGDPSTGSQKPKSNTSGSIDWNKIWPKRKPRRKHDVSEVSNEASAHYSHAADPSTANDNGSSESDSEDISETKSCSYASEHDAQFHALRRHALNSCPELHRQFDDLSKPLSGQKTQNDQRQLPQLRSKHKKDRHRYHFHLRNSVTKRFQSLGRKLRRSASPNYSIRSEYPAPRNSRERRLLARDSVDIWPSSGEETPFFNTPESDITNAGFVNTNGHHIDPLAMAGIIIATAELDRLSSRASLEEASRISGSSTCFTGTSPTPQTPLYSGGESPNNETTMSDSTALDMLPTMPFNTPSSSAPQSGIMSPVSRPPQWRGQRRRAQRSRLSEVTTPDKIASPAESAEDFGEGSASFPFPHIETLPECSAARNSGNDDSLYPKPLAISRGGRDEATSRDNGLPRDTISAPNRTSSIGKTRKPVHGLEEVSGNVEGQPIPKIVPGLSSDLKTPATLAGTYTVQVSTSTANVANESSILGPGVMYTAAAGEPQQDTNDRSCHPDTWTESQGEPGNSDPFCPTDCLETRHSSQDNPSL
ncbi:hypothetical protein AAE478_010111 [Parahypoxylon ruwenzoriense]